MTVPKDKMTYTEAARYLGKKVGTLQNATARGVLTPLPRNGVVRYLSTEQVMLFKDKPLALSALTKEEARIWQNIVNRLGKQSTQLTVVPYLTDERAGEDIGERIGRNYARGIYKGMTEYDPTTDNELKRPLAV